MSTFPLTAAIGACVLALAACAPLEPAMCPTGATAAVSDVLYFGTSTPEGPVTDAEWDTFLREVVTPRFPDGLTVWRGSGQWRSPEGRVGRESTYVLGIVHPESEAAESSLAAIMSRYKSQFRQEAVLRVTTRACVSY